MSHGTAERIEAWFNSHALFNTKATPTTSADQASSPALVADELRKLADLRAQGILTQEEFDRQKRRLLDG